MLVFIIIIYCVSAIWCGFVFTVAIATAQNFRKKNNRKFIVIPTAKERIKNKLKLAFYVLCPVINTFYGIIMVTHWNVFVTTMENEMLAKTVPEEGDKDV